VRTKHYNSITMKFNLGKTRFYPILSLSSSTTGVWNVCSSLSFIECAFLPKSYSYNHEKVQQELIYVYEIQLFTERDWFLSKYPTVFESLSNLTYIQNIDSQKIDPIVLDRKNVVIYIYFHLLCFHLYSVLLDEALIFCLI